MESLQDRKRIDGLELNKRARQIKEGIDNLHGKGCVWEDAEPHNVLIRENGHTVLIELLGDGQRLDERNKSVTNRI